MIKSLYRPCEVILEKETLKGTFHCWEQYSDIIAPSALISSHKGGQISQVFGIVEFEDGSIKRVPPYQIKFILDEDLIKRRRWD
jgi:hypothetical protein